MKCKYCGKNSRVELVTSHGETGVYYVQMCVNCNAYYCSEIMNKCNMGSWCGMASHRSYDGHYFVYSEEYIRDILKDSYEYSLWKAGR